MEYKNCPNCTKKVSGLMSSKYMVKDTTKDFINTFKVPNAEAYCSECAEELIREHISENRIKAEALNKDISTGIGIIPIVTLQSPKNWDYEVLEMISAQSISGTGFLTELTSSWSDITGGQSTMMADKVSTGEEICKTKLRYQCALLGGNAILATDIDYSEVGGGKGMLMVCMAGTAVKLDDKNLSTDSIEKFTSIASKAVELKRLRSIKYPSFEYSL